MDTYVEAKRLVDIGIRNVRVTYQDGTIGKMRLFKASNGEICYYRRRSSRYGYHFPTTIQSITPIQSVKSTEQKWIDGWKKVIAKLHKSGLWKNVVEEIELALSIGYKRMNEAYDLYWKTPNDSQVEVFHTQFPELLKTNDEGNDYINTSVLWAYHSLPKVKKMRFERGSYNDRILAEIQKAMDEKRSYSTDGRYHYDVSFYYNADQQKATYSEEFRGCGNGHYFLALDATHAIFVEDD